jgi:SnoaL-like domain
VTRRALPAVAAVVSFIDCINRGDRQGLADLMSDDHRLVVLDEAPVVGRAANVAAWDGYFAAFPDYVIHPRVIHPRVIHPRVIHPRVIHPRHVAFEGSQVAVLGATTGSHLGLSDSEELALGVIWLADVLDGRLTRWQVADDTPELRAACFPEPVDERRLPG